MKLKLSIAVITGIVLILSSCKKNRDDKPSTALVTIESVHDVQTLFDNLKYMNYNRPFLGELGTDDYFSPTDVWKKFDQVCTHGYTWDANPYGGAEVYDWSYCYGTIYFCNLALESLADLEKKDNNQGGEFVRGQALFHRGFNFWLLAQIFCNPYDIHTAKDSPGIPLRLHSNVNELVTRSTIQQTYDQIIEDLTTACALLPVINQYPTRPSLVASAALLSRVYLSMGNTDSALKYADLSLSHYNKLMNYNSISNTTNSQTPFKQNNEETIFYSTMGSSFVFNNSSYCLVDTLLYASYDDNDLRKTLFFDNYGNYKLYKGSYSGNGSKFTGISTGEVFLTRAECYARKNKITEALNDLDTLLVHRWKNNGTFKPHTTMSQKELLQLIWNERRKELLFRGLRWTDLRRLNTRDTSITLTRIVDGKVYTLPARSPNYTYPIPPEELEKNPMPSNNRN